MRQLNSIELNEYTGGEVLSACFAAGMLGGYALYSGWNPTGWIAGGGALIAGAICIWG